MRKRIAVTALLFYMILKIGSVTAQISIIPNGGISRNAAKRSYDWKQGFSIGVQIFTPISNTFFLGGRIVYNSWPAAGDNWLNKYSEFIGYRYDLESI